MFSDKKRLFVVLLLSVVVIGGLWRMLRHEPSLLDHARKVVMPQSLSNTNNSYFWLNDNEFLYLMPMQKAGANQVMRRNILTGADSVQGDLPSGGVLLSPNGQWALTYKDSRVGSVFTVERTDGSRKLLYRSPGQGLPNLAWMPDDSGLVELLAPFPENGKMHPGLLRAYSLDAAVPIASNTVEEDSPFLSLLGALPDHHVLATDDFPMFYENGKLFISDKVRMLDFSLERDSVARHYTISRPPNALDREAVLSPQGDRIAWLYGIVHIPLGYNKLQSLYTMLHIRLSYTAAIWISKLDGSSLHELGSIPLKGNMGDTTNPPPSHLRWTTNGNNLSFLYQNNLYIIPAQ